MWTLLLRFWSGAPVELNLDWDTAYKAIARQKW
jgi:hypothetical protein